MPAENKRSRPVYDLSILLVTCRVLRDSWLFPPVRVEEIARLLISIKILFIETSSPMGVTNSIDIKRHRR